MEFAIGMCNHYLEFGIRIWNWSLEFKMLLELSIEILEFPLILAPSEGSSLETCPKGTVMMTKNSEGARKFLMGTETVCIRSH